MPTDKERMDWLERGGFVVRGHYGGWHVGVLPHIEGSFPTKRKAIDAALKAERKETKRKR